MKNVRIAYRQLFLAKGCGLQNVEHFAHKFELLGYTVSVYLGKSPSLPIQIGSKSTITFDPTQTMSKTMTFGLQPASQSEYNGSFFAEIFSEMTFQVTDEEYRSLNNPETEGLAKATILDSFELKQGKNIQLISNIVSGFLGLRLHYQFTYETLNETFWIWIDSGNSWSPKSITSAAFRILEGPQLTDEGLCLIKSFSVKDGAEIEDLETMSLCFSLLRKGWQEEDAIYKFIHFFTALELIIKIRTDGKDIKEREAVQKIKNIVLEHAVAEDVDQLLKFVDGMGYRTKSLRARFEEVAKSANFENYIDDVEAFKIFSMARNSLYHGGKAIPLSVTLKSGKEVKLEGLVEQYLNWSFFGDDQPYESRFTPRSKLNRK